MSKRKLLLLKEKRLNVSLLTEKQNLYTALNTQTQTQIQDSKDNCLEKHPLHRTRKSCYILMQKTASRK